MNTQSNYPNIQFIQNLHHEAMQLLQCGLIEAEQDEEKAVFFFFEAYKKEHKACMGLADSTLEPTRSVLFRSAASLAYRCGEYPGITKTNSMRP